MKKVTVSFSVNSPAQLYHSDVPQFCWVSKPVKGVWQQNSSWYSCRETFASQLKHFIRAIKISPPTGTQWPKSRRPIDMKRTRFVMCYKTNGPAAVAKARMTRQENDIKRGLKLVRMLERRAGWVQTQVYRPTNDKSLKELGCNVFIISGSSRWMRSSQLLSLYCLCLRFGACKDLTKLKTLNGMPAFLKTVKANGAQNGDITFFKNVAPYIIPIMDNVKELFMWQSATKFWATQIGSYGVNGLVKKGSTGCQELSNRFNKLKSKVDRKRA